jgi:hypothetical protein
MRAEERVQDGATLSRRRWLWDHSGRLSGVVLGLLGCVFLGFLAAAGWAPAIGLLVCIAAGVGLIAIGGRVRGN